MVKSTYFYFWQICVAISLNYLELQNLQRKTLEDGT